MQLDGELWGGRNTFEFTQALVRRKDANDEWKSVTFQGKLLMQHFTIDLIDSI
jgi:hypothetical protein